MSTRASMLLLCLTVAGCSAESPHDPSLGTVQGAEETYCEPLAKRCLTPHIRQTCTAKGAFWVDYFCPDGTGCDTGECKEQICVPTQPTGQCAGPGAFWQCNESGTEALEADCPTGLTCFAGECANYICTPGKTVCKGFGAVQKCTESGTKWEIAELCEAGGTCSNGACDSACKVSDSKQASHGCDFFTVGLDTATGGSVGVVVSVPIAAVGLERPGQWRSFVKFPGGAEARPTVEALRDNLARALPSLRKLVLMKPCEVPHSWSASRQRDRQDSVRRCP